MTTFAINTDNNITAFTAAEQVPEGQDRSPPRRNWPSSPPTGPSTASPRSGTPSPAWYPSTSLKPVKKFTDRKTAVEPDLEGHPRPDARPAPQAADVAPKKASGRGKRPPPQDAGPNGAREGSKKAIVLDMLKRPDGATLAEIQSATNWQAHSVRGFISGSLTKKMGLTVESSKRDDGQRLYRVAQ